MGKRRTPTPHSALEVERVKKWFFCGWLVTASPDFKGEHRDESQPLRLYDDPIGRASSSVQPARAGSERDV